MRFQKVRRSEAAEEEFAALRSGAFASLPDTDKEVLALALGDLAGGGRGGGRSGGPSNSFLPRPEPLRPSQRVVEAAPLYGDLGSEDPLEAGAWVGAVAMLCAGAGAYEDEYDDRYDDAGAFEVVAAPMGEADFEATRRANAAVCQLLTVSLLLYLSFLSDASLLLLVRRVLCSFSL